MTADTEACATRARKDEVCLCCPLSLVVEVAL